MAKVKAVSILFILISALCLSLAEKVSHTPQKEELTGPGGSERGLKGIIGALLLKKHVVKKALKGAVVLALGAALVIKAKLIMLKLKALGLAALLEKAGIEEPEDVVTEMDLGSACNVALDLGISCTEMASHESVEIQKAVHDMYHVVYYVEEEVPVEEHTAVHYVQCEADYSDGGEVEYYIIKDDGGKSSYHPAEGDAPVEYVIVTEDGSKEPYHGPVEVVTEETEETVETPEIPEDGEVKYEIKTHSPRKSDPTIKVTVPKDVQATTPEKIAVDTAVEGKKTEYVRYKPQKKAGVYDSEALAAFKMKLLENISDDPKFEERDGIYVARMLAA